MKKQFLSMLFLMTLLLTLLPMAALAQEGEKQPVLRITGGQEIDREAPAGGSPRTGDDASFVLFVILAVCAAFAAVAGVTFLCRARNRRR